MITGLVVFGSVSRASIRGVPLKACVEPGVCVLVWFCWGFVFPAVLAYERLPLRTTGKLLICCGGMGLFPAGAGAGLVVRGVTAGAVVVAQVMWDSCESGMSIGLAEPLPSCSRSWSSSTQYLMFSSASIRTRSVYSAASFQPSSELLYCSSMSARQSTSSQAATFWGSCAIFSSCCVASTYCSWGDLRLGKS